MSEQREQVELPSGRIVDVALQRLEFEPWRGAPVADSYGGKQLLALGGRPAFAELVVLERLRAEGWAGVWADSYRQKYRVGMLGEPPVELPEPQLSVMKSILERTGRRGGAWDIFAWRGDECRFVELKRHKRDAVRVNQLQFLEAALDLGQPLSAFLLVEWRLAASVIEGGKA